MQLDLFKAIHIWESPEWKALAEHVKEIEPLHLKEMLQSPTRFNELSASYDNIILDYTRQRVTPKTMELLIKLAEAAKLKEKISAMQYGMKLNVTENRAVLHTALREPKEATVFVDGANVVPEVHKVLDKIHTFSDKVRNGEWVGSTGKKLTQLISIGIGGSYLGPEFVYEALRTDSDASKSAQGRQMKFLANVDPIDIARATEGFDPETTLIVIVSKTFTTAETMLNARSLKQWIVSALEGKGAKESDIVSKHIIAVSTAIEKTKAFGIDENNVFGFWDWVGGRYSVCSAVGMLPLSIHYGYPIMEKFLQGAHSIDVHFKEAPFKENIPVLMGLLGIWNSTFLGYSTRALLPYCQALLRFPAHIQQVDMESNGKRVSMDGTAIPFEAGEIDFGEPGTNGQHSFYQLVHQGRVIPADFIGFKYSQQPFEGKGEVVSNHDELMCNFFAQPDALACGKTVEDLKKEGVPEELHPHKLFPGNRPSSSLLFTKLTPYTTGQLLAIYEHRTAVEGFIWNICSFDQWGVELGKVLASKIRVQMKDTRTSKAAVNGFNPATTALLQKYFE